MKNKILNISLLGLATITLASCAARDTDYSYPKLSLNKDEYKIGLVDYPYVGLLKYPYASLSYHIAEKDPIRNEYTNIFSMADYELDSKIAGPRQGDEQSLAFKSLNQRSMGFFTGVPTKDDWNIALKDGAYYNHGPRGWTTGDMEPKEYLNMFNNNPRIKELNRNYNLMHVADKDYVFKHCKISPLGALTTGYGKGSVFLDPKYEDLYMYRSWSPIVSTFGMYRYAYEVETEGNWIIEVIIKAPPKQIQEYRDNSPEYPTHIYLSPLSSYDSLPGTGMFKALDLIVPKKNRQIAYATFFICTPEQSQEARKEYFKKNPRYRQEAIDLRKKLGLEPEDI